MVTLRSGCVILSSDRHSPEPDHSCGEVDEACEVNRPPIVACREAAEVPEAIEAALDAVVTFAGRCIMRDEDLPGSVGRDHRCRAEAGAPPSQGMAVISFVVEHGTAGQTVDQSGSGGDIAHLAGRDDKTQRTFQSFGKPVDLGGQSASGTPQRLILGPLFHSSPFQMRWCPIVARAVVALVPIAELLAGVRQRLRDYLFKRECHGNAVVDGRHSRGVGRNGGSPALDCSKSASTIEKLSIAYGRFVDRNSINEASVISIRQIKAARAMLAWSQGDLSVASGVSEPTIARLEAADGPLGGRSDTALKIISALEAAGVEFTNGGQPGVRMRAMPEEGKPTEQLNASNDD